MKHTPEDMVLDNALGLDAEGWALIAPYGEHRKDRLVLRDGRIVRETYIQQVDEAVVDELLANENGSGILGRIKRAIIKRPVFKGHPDLKQHSRETVGADAGPASPIGVLDENRKSSRGMESRFALIEEGALAVENEGCKFPSILWLVRRTGEMREGAEVVRPYKILSVGLTPTPNISGVDSLANAKTNTPAAKPEETQHTDPMKQLLIGWLAAQGVVLANDATDQQVMERIQSHHTSRAGEITALSNDKSTLTGRITALENDKSTLTTERDQLKTKLCEKDTALANAQTALANERKMRATALADLAITQGRKAVAERDQVIKDLTEAADFEKAATALANSTVVHKTAASMQGERKQDARIELTPRQQLLHLANSDPRYKDIADWQQAEAAILRDHPALAEQLKTATIK